MSSTSIELFRQHTERQRQKQELRHTARPSEDPKQPSLIAKMSRIQHEVRQVFGDASALSAKTSFGSSSCSSGISGGRANKLPFHTQHVAGFATASSPRFDMLDTLGQYAGSGFCPEESPEGKAVVMVLRDRARCLRNQGPPAPPQHWRTPHTAGRGGQTGHASKPLNPRGPSSQTHWQSAIVMV